MKTPIHIVIPYYCGEKFIRPCVDSILTQEEPVHIWIIDNGPEALQTDTFDEHITVIRTREGIGYGRAANVGVAAAMSEGGQLFIVTNQDTIFEHTAIGILAQGLGGSTELNIPVLLDYDSDDISEYFYRTVVERSGLDNGDLKTGGTSRFETAFGYGACLAFSRSLVEAVGLFDPAFKMYGEDEDLFQRVRKSGGQVKVCIGARVHHFHQNFNSDDKTKESIDGQKLKSSLLRILKNDRHALPHFLKVWAYSVYMAIRKGKPGLALNYAFQPVINLMSGRSIQYLTGVDVQKRIRAQVLKDTFSQHS